MIPNFVPNKVVIETETNEKVQALLFKAFPLIIVLNSFLNFVLSLNLNYYNTFIKILIYLLIYNFQLVYYFLPLIMVITYSNFNFFINSIYLDIYNDSPTINEIMINLNNLMIKLKRLNEIFNFNFNVINYLLVISPLYILLIKFQLIQLNLIVLINVIIITNLNSNWLISTILLFKRFKFFKSILILDNWDYLNNYTIINSLKDDHKIIQFRIKQNQRRYLYHFTNYLFPIERSNFTDLNNLGNYSIDKIPFNDINFKWLDETWKIENDWTYYDLFWLNKLNNNNFSFTRSRILTKKAILKEST